MTGPAAAAPRVRLSRPVAAPTEAPASGAAHDLDKLHVVLLNGGGSPDQNFSSHLSHLRRLSALLREAGVTGERLTVFSSDGADPGADLAVAGSDPFEGQALLDGTDLGELLAPSLAFANSELPEIAIRPATRRALRQWFGKARASFKPGDTLFLFVTDHGTNPSANHQDPRASRITLWGRDELSVGELREMLEMLDPRVRVVTVMSQCFSGGFAHLLETHSRDGVPSGAACGYFSSTAHRPAYGCYAETADADETGHAFEFLRALAESGSFNDAHLATLERDDTPDVPLRSSDVYLQNLLADAAGRSKKQPDEYADEVLARALKDRKRWEPELRLLDRLGDAYGLLSPRSFAELATVEGQMASLLDQLDQHGKAWSQALGDLTTHNLNAFVSKNPGWRARLQPRQVAALPASARSALASDLLKALRPFSDKRPRFIERLERVFARIDDLREMSYRMEVRLATALRMRTVLTQIAGRMHLEENSQRPHRRGYQALLGCESLSLPLRGAPDRDPREPRRLANLSADREALAGLIPAGLGIEFRGLDAGPRKRLDLPAGAAVITRVVPESAADQAGLAVGDIVVGEPEQPFGETNQVRVWTMLSPTGTALPLVIQRNGQRQTMTVTLQPRPVRWPELPARPAVGSRAPTLDGLSRYRGEPAVKLAADGPYVLFFFATWCGPCKQAIPELLDFSRRRNVPVVAVTDEDRDVLDGFFAGYEKPFPGNVASDDLRTLFSAYAISGTPTFVLVGADGTVQEQTTGYARERGLGFRGWRWQAE